MRPAPDGVIIVASASCTKVEITDEEAIHEDRSWNSRMGVSIVPGAYALTVMPCAPHSQATEKNLSTQLSGRVRVEAPYQRIESTIGQQIYWRNRHLNCHCLSSQQSKKHLEKESCSEINT